MGEGTLDVATPSRQAAQLDGSPGNHRELFDEIEYARSLAAGDVPDTEI